MLLRIEQLLLKRILVGAALVFVTLIFTFIFWSAMEIADLKKENRLLKERYRVLAQKIGVPEQRSLPIDAADVRQNAVKKDVKKSVMTASTAAPVKNTPIQSQTVSMAVAPESLHQLTQNRPTEKKTKTQPNIADLPDLSAPTAKLPVTLNNGPTDRKIVSLTFDGGSLANAAAEILDTLRSRNVKATMFFTGEFIRRFPDVTRHIVAEGHEAGNHTFSHPHLTSFAQDHTQTCLPDVNASFICRELRNTEKKFIETTGRPFAPLWRAPYGESNSAICRWGQACGYLHVGWRQGGRWSDNLDSNDWIPDEETRGYRSPQEVLDKILAAACSPPNGINGGIILMHLGTVRTDRDKQVHLILGTIIDRLRERGYTFVTAGEMAEAAGIDVSLLPGRSGGNHLSTSTSTPAN